MILRWVKKAGASDLPYFIGILLIALLFQSKTIPLKAFWDGHLFGDTITLMYIMAWGAHAIFHSPMQYYNPPFFYPTENVLFSTDGMELPALLFSPLWYMFNNPALLANVVLFTSHVFALAAGFYGSRVVLNINRPTALAIAIAYAGCSDRFWHSVDHLNLVYSGIIPALFSVTWACLSEDKTRYRVLLILALGCSVYLSVYFFVLGGFAIMCAVTAWLISYGRLPTQAVLRGFALALAIGICLCAPKIIAYYAGSQENTRSHIGLAEASHLSASWNGYLRPVIQPNRFESHWYSVLSKPTDVKYVQEDGQFIGFAVLALLLVELSRLTLRAVRRDIDRYDRLSIICVALAILLMLVSFGPAYKIFGLSPYRIVYELGLKFTSFFRAPARFAFISYWLLLLSAGICLLKLLQLRRSEYLLVPVCALAATWFEHLPASHNVYHQWKRHKLFDVMERHDPTRKQAAASFGYDMTLHHALSSAPHWRPVINGWYGAAKGQDYDRRYWNFKEFPTTHTVAWLARNNVRWIMTHEPVTLSRMQSDSSFTFVGEDLGIRLFQLNDADKIVMNYDRLRQERRKYLAGERTKTPDVLHWPDDKAIQLQGGTGFQLIENRPRYTTDNSYTVNTFWGFRDRLLPGLYDKVEITYTLSGAASEHECKVYWKSEVEPMSEKRSSEGNVTLVNDEAQEWKVVFALHEKVEWMTDNSVPQIRFDFTNFSSLEAVNVTIHSIKFFRLAETPEIPYI